MIRDPIVRHANWQSQAFGMPAYAFRSWLAQYEQAKAENIPFLFSLHSWFWWWRSELRKRGPEAYYGLRTGQYRMVRIAADGAYEVGNVAVEMVVKPARMTKSERMLAWHRENVSHLSGRFGKDHPRSKPVMTPKGRFSSLSEAAEAFNVSPQRVHQYLKRYKGRVGWSYVG